MTIGNDRWRSPSGALDEVLMAAQRRLFPNPPVVLAQAAYRGAFRWGRVKLKVEEHTRLDRTEVLILIDANTRALGLDLSGCLTREIDLSRETIQREWSASPDSSGRNPPLWKSRDTEGVDLHGARLDRFGLSGAMLDGADFGMARMRRAGLASAKAREASFFGADLRGARLTATDLRRANLAVSNLRGAFLDRTSFVEANLTSADLRDVHAIQPRFDGATLWGARLDGVDFSSLEPGAMAGVFWTNAVLDRTRIRREQLAGSIGEEIAADQNRRRWRRRNADKVVREELDDQAHGDWKSSIEYRAAREVYLNLKNNFNSIGRYGDASWAYQKEREMERKAYGQEWCCAPVRKWSSLWLWATNWLACLVTGYGELPWRPVRATIVVIAAFAA